MTNDDLPTQDTRTRGERLRDEYRRRGDGRWTDNMTGQLLPRERDELLGRLDKAEVERDESQEVLKDLRSVLDDAQRKFDRADADYRSKAKRCDILKMAVVDAMQVPR